MYATEIDFFKFVFCTKGLYNVYYVSDMTRLHPLQPGMANCVRSFSRTLSIDFRVPAVLTAVKIDTAIARDTYIYVSHPVSQCPIIYSKLVLSWFYELGIVQYQQNTKYTDFLAGHHSGCILGLKAAGNYLYIVDLKDSNSDKYDRV